MMKLLMFGMCGSLLLAGCTATTTGKHSSPSSPAPSKLSSAAHSQAGTGKVGAAADFTAGLSGRWHNNDFSRAGATKQFTPSMPGARSGRADGFWPTGGTYRITAADPAARSLQLEVKSKPAGDDQPPQSFRAKVVLSADGRHLSFEQVEGAGGPAAPITFYRVP